MTIFRGEGGGGDATTDSEINLITSLTNSITADKAITLAAADSATASANAAAASEAGVAADAASAVTAASNAATSESNANASALNASNSAAASLVSANASAASAASADISEANAAASAASASAIVLGVSSGLPSIRPTLNLDFANSAVVDPRITFTRASTATYYDSLGVLKTAASGVPRLDYDPVTFAAKGLLIEEARTNLLTYSSTFNNVPWTASLSTVTANVTTSPDGTVNSFSMSKSAAYGHVRQQVTVTNGNYAASVYIKAGTEGKASFGVTENGTATILILGSVNLTTGVVTNNSGTFTATSVGNGWWRLTGACTTTTGTNISLLVYPGIYSGTETGTVYIWGAQVEAGAFATSYIPTTTAQATRAADNASMTGTNFSSWYRADEGALYFSVSLISPSYSAGVALDIGAGGAFGTTEYVNYSGTQWGLNPNVAPLNVTSLVTAAATAKVAAAIKANDTVVSANGLIGVVDTSCAIAASPTTLSIGKGGWSGAANYLNGTISSIAYYPKRISNTELQALTA
jgi:hypothetical protein